MSVVTERESDSRLDLIEAVKVAEMSAERRRHTRIKRKVATQMTAWEVGRAAAPFGVVIEDISKMGVGIIHDQELPIGGRYLLTVPRADSHAVVVEVKVVRIQKRGEKSYLIGLTSSTVIENVEQTRKTMRLTSKRVRMLFVAFGVVALLVAAFYPL